MIECVLVLCIVSILSIPPVLKYSDFKHRQDIKSQLIAFERMYELCQHSAIVEKRYSTIKSSAADNTLTFEYSYFGRAQTEVLVIEKPLKLTNSFKLNFTAYEATPSALETFKFLDEKTQRTVYYVVQMGNGKLFRYET